MTADEVPEVVDVHSALEPAGVGIDVPDGVERTLGPSDKSGGRLFRWARVESFEDLKLLGLLPDELDAERSVEAVREDSWLAIDSAGFQMGCQPPTGQIRGRLNTHTHLIEMMREVIPYEIHPSHPIVLKVHSVVTRFVNDRLGVVGVASLRDITIGSRATLKLSPSVTVLSANDITIGDEGRMRFLGKSIVVRANTLNGPSQQVSAVAKFRGVGWLAELQQAKKG